MSDIASVHKMSVENVRWVLRGDPLPGEVLGDEGIFPKILQYLIQQRNLASDDEMEEFLHPKLKNLSDPFLLPDMKKAVTRIFQAIDANEKICIFGDYDVDGVSSIAIMKEILQAYGAEVRYFVPRRSMEGYGLSQAALKRCMSEGAKPDLLIAVDCGTGSVQEIAELTAQGIDVMVLDHHEPHPTGKPVCVALVNPKCGDDWKYLCAAGVCFKVAHALLKTRPIEHFDLKKMLELVTVATVADIVPMIGENRMIVRHGLSRLPQSSNKGLRAIQKIAGVNGQATSMDVGFRIGPRLNAAGRMDAPEDALATLLCKDTAEAEQLARKLDHYNRERQAMEDRMRKEAHDMLQEYLSHPVIVLGSRDWHPGVVGIVASRLMRMYHRPAFVISIDENGIGKGSGRSVAGVSLVEAISATRHLLEAGGGHEMAAGISVKEENIHAFRDAFSQYVMERTTEDQRTARIMLDAELTFDLLSLDFLKSYELLQPFGSGNPQPVFLAREVHLTRPPMRLKNKHLRLFMRQENAGHIEQSAMFFNACDRTLPDPPWDIAFTIDRNEFRGVTSLQMIIQDVRAASDVFC